MSPSLPTPSTSHVSFSTIYEPSEDSFLLLDTLSSQSEQQFFRNRFLNRRRSALPKQYSHTSTLPSPPTPPLVLEVGTGSGVVIAFLTAHAEAIFGQKALGVGVDVNIDACLGTRETVERAIANARATKTTSSNSVSSNAANSGIYLGSINGDLTSCLRPNSIDVLVFNPPYVPTEILPVIPDPPLPPEPRSDSGANSKRETDRPESLQQEQQQRQQQQQQQQLRAAAAQARHERESHLLALSYAGGQDGMETTNRLLEQIPTVLSQRGVAYVLLCARNRPDEVREEILRWRRSEDDDDGDVESWRWRAEIVGESGGKGGWERLVVLRIWRDRVEGSVEAGA